MNAWRKNNGETMKTLVITGGMGSGKSVVCRYLSSRGIPVYDCDSRTKAIYYENPLVVMDIEEELGESVSDGQGVLDRRKMGAIIFGNKEKLAIVEGLVHPMIYDDFVAWRDSNSGKAPFVVMESAIFLNKPLFHPLADAVMMVEARRDERIRRAVERDGSTTEAVLQRMEAQQEVSDLVDIVVENDSDILTLYKRVDEAIEQLKDKLY